MTGMSYKWWNHEISYGSQPNVNFMAPPSEIEMLLCLLEVSLLEMAMIWYDNARCCFGMTGGLCFIFCKDMLFFLCLILLFWCSRAPKKTKNTHHSRKKKHATTSHTTKSITKNYKSDHKNHHKKHNAYHTHIKKQHTSYHKKYHTKKHKSYRIIPQKKTHTKKKAQITPGKQQNKNASHTRKKTQQKHKS